MTQTIVDEECLWESEDTYVVAISGPVLEKIWRERNEAVEKLYGEFVAKRKQDPLAGPDEDPAAAKPQTNIDLPKSLTKVHRKKVNGKDNGSLHLLFAILWQIFQKQCKRRL